MAITRATVTILSDTLVLNTVDATGQIINASSYELQNIASRYTVRPNGDKQFSLLYNEAILVSVSNSSALSGFNNTLFGSTDPVTAKIIYDALIRSGSVPAQDTDSIYNTRVLTSATDSVAAVITDGTTAASIKPASTAALATDRSLVVAVNPTSGLATSTLQGTTNTLLTDIFAELDTLTNVDIRDLNSAADSVASVQSGSWGVSVINGAQTAAVKAASTAPVAADPALVVAISPNSLVATEVKQDTQITSLASIDLKLSNVGVGSPYTATAAANTNTVVTLPATTGRAWIIYNVEFSYAGTPDPDKTLVITEGATVRRTTQVTASGAGPLTINQIYAAGAAVTVTLLAGGAGVVGSVNITAKLAD
jgi:hypothetical protein